VDLTRRSVVVADPVVDLLWKRMVDLRTEQTVLIRSSQRLLMSGAPYPADLVTNRLTAMQAHAWRIAGDLYQLGATDAAFDAVCGWTFIP
jgi:hypothetical protein